MICPRPLTVSPLPVKAAVSLERLWKTEEDSKELGQDDHFSPPSRFPRGTIRPVDADSLNTNEFTPSYIHRDQPTPSLRCPQHPPPTALTFPVKAICRDSAGPNGAVPSSGSPILWQTTSIASSFVVHIHPMDLKASESDFYWKYCFPKTIADFL